MTLSLRTFQEGIARLAVAFDAKTDEARTAVYWEELADLSDEAFTVAVKRALREWDKPFALPTLHFLRSRAEQASGAQSADQLVGNLRRKICFRYSPTTRPGADLTPEEATIVHDLGMTPGRLAGMELAEFDKWLTWTYRPAVERGLGQRATSDALLDTNHLPLLTGGGR